MERRPHVAGDAIDGPMRLQPICSSKCRAWACVGGPFPSVGVVGCPPHVRRCCMREGAHAWRPPAATAGGAWRGIAVCAAGGRTARSAGARWRAVSLPAQSAGRPAGGECARRAGGWRVAADRPVARGRGARRAGGFVWRADRASHRAAQSVGVRMCETERHRRLRKCYRRTSGACVASTSGQDGAVPVQEAGGGAAGRPGVAPPGGRREGPPRWRSGGGWRRPRWQRRCLPR